MKIVGIFQKSKNFGFVVPDNPKNKNDIFISKSKWGKAKNNDKVVVEIIKNPEKNKKAEGKIVEILGKIDEAGVDLLSIIKDFNLPYEFSNKVIKEAKVVCKEEIKLNSRRDFRDNEIFTIDGEDAKDLDDAVEVRKNEDGTYTLGVHIADVSHYVKEGSDIDNEAIRRGTSVYMLDRVIPMLPKELSNGVCSLNQKEDKYAVSVIMQIDKMGKVIDSDICKSIINVTKRMTYKEVKTIIERNDEKSNYNHCFVEKNNSDNRLINKEKYSSIIKKEKKKYLKILNENEAYLEHFDRMKELAQILKNRRKKEGYLSLEIPECEIILNKNGKPLEIKPYEQSFANEIIEQFMLTANETVAETFFWLNAPFIYRVHESPDEEKVKELNKLLFNFGYKIKGKKDEIKPKAFSQIIDDVKGKEEQRVVCNLILRTLKIAKYEAKNKGHFGIASKYYCHFTSPIRRYPDLFIHRIISEYLEKSYNIPEKMKEKYRIQAIRCAEISSDCEQNATKAERESESMKMAEYMERKIGHEYDGIVSSITNFGMFIELDNTVQGLVRFEDMKDDYYIYDESRRILIGKDTKKVYKLGDKIKIRVVYSNKNARKINFEII